MTDTGQVQTSLVWFTNCQSVNKTSIMSSGCTKIGKLTVFLMSLRQFLHTRQFIIIIQALMFFLIYKNGNCCHDNYTGTYYWLVRLVSVSSLVETFCRFPWSVESPPLSIKFKPGPSPLLNTHSIDSLLRKKLNFLFYFIYLKWFYILDKVWGTLIKDARRGLRSQ